MVRVSFQRAAIAILLMGMMIEPLGICLQQSHKGAHSCCMQPESSNCLQTNCCVVQTHPAAILPVPTPPITSPTVSVYEYSALVQLKALNDHPLVAVAPPFSPSIGAYILRI